jgi:O-antigen/teichoic acid export membrane protein
LTSIHIKKIIKDTGWVMVLNVFNYSSAFLIAVLITRFLGITQLGVYSFAVASSMLLYVISDFGLTTLLVRKIGENKSLAHGWIVNANKAKLFLGTTVLLILFAAGLFFNIKQFNMPFKLAALAVLPRLVQTSYESSIRVFGYQKYPTIIRSINSLVQVFSALFLLMYGFGLIHIFLIILLLEITTAFVFRQKNNFLIESAATVQPVLSVSIFALFKEASVLFLNNSLAFSIPRIHIILLEYINGTASVGIYSSASRFVSGVGLLSGSLHNALYPFLSSFQQKEEEARNIARKLLIYSLLAGALISVLPFFLSGILIDITFKIEEAKAVLKILSFSVIPVLVYTVLQSYLITFNREKIILGTMLPVWIFNLVFCLLMLNFYGYIGCAVTALAVEWVVMLVLLVYFIYIIKTC